MRFLSFFKNRCTVDVNRSSHGQELSSLVSDCNRLRADREIILHDRNSLEQERDALRAEREIILHDRNSLEQERDALRTEREIILHHRNSLEQERDTLRTAHEINIRDISLLEQERDALRTERQIILIERENYRVEKVKYEEQCLRLRNLLEVSKLMLRDHETVLTFVDHSKSQLAQDLFVLGTLGLKRRGFFVEFGATNGVDISNTYLLETRFEWTGILAEPARCWHETLRANRSAHLDFNCVWRSSGDLLTFNEVTKGELSTIDVFSANDFLVSERKHGRTYEVPTISLMDLLKKHGAPEVIDYLSIDTEGSEFDILSSFDFSKYKICIITCEHNYTPNREKIYELLTRNGFRRVHESISGVDDWYVHSLFLSKANVQ